MTIPKKDYIICYNNILHKSFNSWRQACEFVHSTYDSFNPNEPLSNHRMLKLRKKIKDSIKDSRTYCGLIWKEEKVC